MTCIVILWQDKFGHWQRFQENHNQADAYRTDKDQILEDKVKRTGPADDVTPFMGPGAMGVDIHAATICLVDCWWLVLEPVARAVLPQP